MKELKDAVYGFIVGDALGVPYEFKKRGTYECKDMIGYGTWNQPIGTWSDDSSMMLATMESIKRNKKIIPEDIMNNFKKWYYECKFTPHNQVFDIGGTTFNAVVCNKPGTHENENGNGALMRILPLAFIKHTEEDVIKVSGLTHAHSISCTACLLYVKVAEELIKGKNIKEALSNLEIIHPFERIKNIWEYDEESISASGYVLSTLEAVFYVLTKTTSYKECVLKAVNLGDDTDTVAAIAGGLAGIIYGIEEIPKEWIKNIVRKDLIEECIF